MATKVDLFHEYTFEGNFHFAEALWPEVTRGSLAAQNFEISSPGEIFERSFSERILLHRYRLQRSYKYWARGVGCETIMIWLHRREV